MDNDPKKSFQLLIDYGSNHLSFFYRTNLQKI